MKTEAGHVGVSLSREDFSLEVEIGIPARGVTGVFGPSGCGKTTLLRCIAGLEPEARGRVQVNGDVWQDAERFVPAWRRAVGYVFQEARLFPHLTVRRNLSYGRRRSQDGTDLATPQSIIAMLDIDALLDRMPSQLSGGERQRAAIARALFRRPNLVLMDEPLANLDALRKQEILPFLDRLHGRLTLPMLYVSHNLDEITRLCDHLIVMEEGRVLAQGELSELLVRSDLPMLGGEQASSVLDGKVVAYDEQYELTKVRFAGGELSVPGYHANADRPIRLRIMARDVSLCLERPRSSSIINILEGIVESIHTQVGGYALVCLQVGQARLLARITRKSTDTLGLAPGQTVFAQIKGVAVKSGEPGRSWAAAPRSHRR